MPVLERPTEITSADLEQLFVQFRATVLPAVLDSVSGAEMSAVRTALANILVSVVHIFADAGVIRSHIDLHKKVCQPIVHLMAGISDLARRDDAVGLMSKEIMRRLRMTRIEARRHILHSFCLFDVSAATPKSATLFGFDPSVEIDMQVELGDNCQLAAGVVLLGCVKVDDDAVIGPNVIVIGTVESPAVIGSGAMIGQDSVIDGVTIPAGVVVPAGQHIHGSKSK